MANVKSKEYPIIEIKNLPNKNIVFQNLRDINTKNNVKTSTYYFKLENESTSKENQDVAFVSIDEALDGETIQDPSGAEYVALEVQDSGQIILHDKDVVLWGELCRICANPCDQFVPIFSGEGLENSLSNKIHAYLPLRVSENDDLPHQLCYNCAATLVAYDDIYRGCLDAQKRLNDLHDKLVPKDPIATETAEDENFETILEVDKNKDENEIEEVEDNNLTETQRYYNVEDGDEVIAVFATADSSATPKKQAPSSDPVVREARRKELDQVKITSSDNLTLYKCPECFKVLSTPYNYFTHKRIHTQDKRCTCKLCGKSFTATSSLSRHIREVHDKIKEFECAFCPRRLASKIARDEHEHTHTNERPFVCSECGKTFRQRASLSVHKRFHSKNFWFHCQFCNRGFLRKQDMERHEVTHSDPSCKPYSCKICSKSFRSSASAIRHRQTHNSDIKRHVCDVCGDIFTQERYLKNHCKKMHKDR